MERFRAHRFRGYTIQHFRNDAIAGLIVGIIAIPLGMAFAIASGVKPETGIYTTIIAGFLISLFGGSKYQIGGPTGAFIPILLGIVLMYGYENLLIAGFMAGIILLLLGVFKLGSLIKYIPRPVTIGFTAGIAVIIFSSQIVNFLGLVGVQSHVRFLNNMREILLHLHTFNGYSFLTAGISLATIIIMPKVLPKIPSTLIGLAFSTIVALLLFPDQVATIGSTYGEIHQGFPALQFPEITLERLQLLFIPALMIALLGGIESLLSAVVADGMTNDRHHSHRELMGQGIANIITPLFGGIPATGAIARTATNINSGAISPVSGMIHSVVVLLVLIIFAPFASSIPLASIAPILMVVAWNMSERKRFAYMLKMRSQDSFILVVTFLLTVFVDLMTGVGAGVLLAFILFIVNMSKTVVTPQVIPSSIHAPSKITSVDNHEHLHCANFSIINVEGVLFFGSAQSFEQQLLDAISHQPKTILLRMNKVPFMDISCASYFSGVVNRIQQYGGTVLIAEMRAQPMSLMIKSGLFQTIGATQFFSRTDEAMEEARKLVAAQPCTDCQQLISGRCYNAEPITLSGWMVLSKK